ncbi:MAG: acylphosphatase [Deltaproteobacteria bacterium]|nr:acylphosphatase [Deltaproteobacteria bacterium]
MPLARAHLIVHGRVQGVWFRGGTQSFARSRGVTGWVRNRAEGTVEAVLEGDEESVRAVVAWCREGPPGARVDRVELKWAPHVGEFDQMVIAHSY